MRILIINNYSMKQSLTWYKARILPAHHCWGCDMIEQQKGVKLRFALYKINRFFFKLHLARIAYCILQCVFLLKAVRCKVVYAAASPLIDWMGYLKYMGLYNKRLVIVVHHPRNFSMKRQLYDKIIFICKDAYKQAIEDYPQLAEHFEFQEWGPDLNFYEDIRADLSNLSFVSNGITSRDNNTLITAAKEIEYQVGVLCNQQSIPSSYNKLYKNVKLIYNEGTMMDGKIMSYKEMLNFISKYSVCVIPTYKKQKALCGLTSFCDAIAMGMPVLLSNTTHISVDFHQDNFGCYYEAENVQNLLHSMKSFENPEQRRKMAIVARKYAEKHNYEMFAKAICKAVLNQ